MIEPSRFGPDDLSGRPSGDILREIADSLRSAASFLVVTHVNPDGDALGSQLALTCALRELGKEVCAALLEEVPSRLAGFVPAGMVTVVDSIWIRNAAGKYDWCVVLDTSEPERIGDLAEVVFREDQRRLCLDHHLHEGRELFQSHLVLREAASTSSIVLALIEELGVEVDARMACLLWLGLATDTGWFRFSNTDSRALRDGARLLSRGNLDPETLYEQVYGYHRLDRTRLLGEVLSTLREALDGRFVWGFISRKAREVHRVDRSELDGMIDHIRQVQGAMAVALITEVDECQFKISLRAQGDTDVERMARHFGGGGHRKAAGCGFQGSLEELENELVRVVSHQLDGKPDLPGTSKSAKAGGVV